MTIALFWLLLLCCIAIFHRKEEYALFDLAHTLPLRGILATLVVLGHLDTVVSAQTKILMPFHMATPAVAVFFFMSGYGLMLSFSKKGGSYLQNFILKASIKLLIPLLVTTCLYQGLLFILGDFSIKKILIDLASGIETPLIHSWYVYALFLFYLLYYIVFKYNNELKKWTGLILILLMLIYYVVIRYILNWPFYWWITCMAFPMGLFYSRHEDKIKMVLKDNYWGILPIIIALLSIKLLSGMYTPFFAELPYILLGPIIAIILYRIPLPIKNKTLNFLGSLSFEIYLTHGIFEMLLHASFESPYVYILAVITATIVTSWILHNAYKKITNSLLYKLR